MTVVHDAHGDSDAYTLSFGKQTSGECVNSVETTLKSLKCPHLTLFHSVDTEMFHALDCYMFYLSFGHYFGSFSVAGIIKGIIIIVWRSLSVVF